MDRECARYKAGFGQEVKDQPVTAVSLPRRTENKGLPARWQLANGAYYYRVKPGLEHLWDGKKRFRLGATLPEAYKTYADRVGRPERCGDIGQLLDLYLIKTVPKKAPRTQAENQRAIRKLRAVFGHMPLLPFPPKLVYQYIDKRGALTAAHREIEVLSHAYTKAVEWGLIDRHPFKGEVRLDGDLAPKPKTRCPEDWEIVEALSLKPLRKKGSVLMCQAYIRLKLLTGLARSDLLRLKFGEHLREDGIHVTRHKTANSSGKTTIYEYAKVPERREAVEQAKRARPVDISPFLFCNSRGDGYIDEATGMANGFDSIWQRFMDRVMAETKVSRRFTEHSMRKLVANNAESIDKARALLQHADTRTTLKWYRTRPERV